MNGIVIIGNGISGVTCARHLRKNNKVPITIISSETKHFYSRTALMYVYMGHMKYEHIKPYEDWFWEKNKIDLIEDHVTKVDSGKKEITLQNSGSFQYDKLVIASGSISNIPDVKGTKLKNVQALYGMADLKQLEENTKNLKSAVIVGGGLIGIEMAEMLLSRNIQVTFLVREGLYWGNILPKEEAEMIGSHIKEHHIILRTNEELQEILGDSNGKVYAIKTKNGEVINCDFVGLTVGVSPNISFLKETTIEVDRGVLVDEFFKTNAADIFAIGDCAQHKRPLPGRKPVEQLWYTGKLHGETLARTLCGEPTTYSPGPWFNSAKFLDIEYQTYGEVNATLQEGQRTFYWQHLKKHIALRAVFNNDNTIAGVNAMGMRLRHEVLNDWLLKKVNIDHVMKNLSKANFDPEFYKKYEQDILQKYNTDFSKKIIAERKNKRKLFSFS